MSKSLKNIGTLEITKSNLKKQIGDLTTTYDYDKIVRLELQNYFKNMSITKPNSFIKSLRIINYNHIEEVLIISDRSIDFKQKISITDSLKTLKKLTHIDIEIKNN